jgi:hypothetical protein
MFLKSVTLAASLLITAVSAVPTASFVLAQAAGGGQGGGGTGTGSGSGGGTGNGSANVDIVARVPSSIARGGPTHQPPTIYIPSRQPSRPMCANGMTPLGYLDCVPR